MNDFKWKIIVLSSVWPLFATICWELGIMAFYAFLGGTLIGFAGGIILIEYLEKKKTKS